MTSQHFKYILYADDTTLFTTVQFRSATQIDINNELSNVHNWLAVNKLSLNVKKTKYVLVHAINKPTQALIPELAIDGIILNVHQLLIHQQQIYHANLCINIVLSHCIMSLYNGFFVCFQCLFVDLCHLYTSVCLLLKIKESWESWVLILEIWR